MAEDDTDPSRDAGDEPDRGPLTSFDVEEEPEGSQPSMESEAGDDGFPLTRRSRTILALVTAALVAVATTVVAQDIVQRGGAQIGLGETVGVGLISAVVAVAGLIAFRWGLWVVPFVTITHYGLNFYNMLFEDSSVYQFLEGSAMGYAVLAPALGVGLGWVLEGIYRLVAPS